MKRILTVLAGVSLLASFFAAAPAPVSAGAPGGWWQSPDVIVATRDRFPGSSNGTCSNPDYTSLETAMEDLDDSDATSSHTIGVCKGTYLETESAYVEWDDFVIVGQGASNTVIDGSKLAVLAGGDDGIIEYSQYDITVANITFKGGAGTYGGAIYTADDFSCISSSFIGNSANEFYDGEADEYYGGEGGAVYAEGDIFLNRCTFRNNTADVAGGAVYGEGSIIDYGGNYSLNTAGHGGAVAQGDIIVSDYTAGFYSSTFTKNSAFEGDGGAIAAGDGDTFVVASRFTGNTASDDGGAIAKEGCSVPTTAVESNPVELGILMWEKCQFEVSNSVFSANTAGYGGGAIASFDYSTGVTISGNTFQMNRASSGAAILSVGFLDAGSNQFVRNTSASYSGGIIAFTVNRQNDYCDHGLTIADNYHYWDGDSWEMTFNNDDIDYVYHRSVLDSSRYVNFAANRFVRNIGASTARWGVPGWANLYELNLSSVCFVP